MRLTSNVLLAASVLILSACGEAGNLPKAEPDQAAIVVPPPPPPRVNLSACAHVAEAVANERLLGERSVEEASTDVYAVTFKGETSTEDYALECVGDGFRPEFTKVTGPRIGGVNRTDIVPGGDIAIAPVPLALDTAAAVATGATFRGTVDSDGFVNTGLMAFVVDVPSDGSYCPAAITKFDGASGKGSTFVAADGGEWVNWGHPVEDGASFSVGPAFELSAGEHTLYVKRRESLIKEFRLGSCS